MSSATLTSKGQTTIPKDIRDALGLKPKDRIHYTLMPDGTVIMRAKTRSIVSLEGMLHDPERKPLTIEQMQAWRR
ncbi:MAG: type II toxin-antitoxin system PrlF family antitoxin [Pseudomonadota bacterium]